MHAGHRKLSPAPRPLTEIFKMVFLFWVLLYIFDAAALRPPFSFLAFGTLTLPLRALPFSLVSRSA